MVFFCVERVEVRGSGGYEKKELNRDGQLFHQYLYSLNRHNNVAGLNVLMGSQPFPLHNWISNGKTYINNVNGILTIFYITGSPTTKHI
jgi:hypothetical protein